jgi:hypothetical protein
MAFLPQAYAKRTHKQLIAGVQQRRADAGRQSAPCCPPTGTADQWLEQSAIGPPTAQELKSSMMPQAKNRAKVPSAPLPKLVGPTINGSGRFRLVPAASSIKLHPLSATFFGHAPILFAI